jgi:uncharacterized membrane protein YeaQ/YmgE (transglycosylase-associated protein family)
VIFIFAKAPVREGPHHGTHPRSCPELGVNTVGIISWLIVGAIAGWLAGLLVKGDEGLGVIGHIVLGIVGGLVGGFLAGIITGGKDYTTGINITTIVVAAIGAVIVVVAWNAIRGTSRTGRGPI